MSTHSTTCLPSPAHGQEVGLLHLIVFSLYRETNINVRAHTHTTHALSSTAINVTVTVHLVCFLAIAGALESSFFSAC